MSQNKLVLSDSELPFDETKDPEGAWDGARARCVAQRPGYTDSERATFRTSSAEAGVES